ncbi:hypothetical protein YPPY89_2223, partial [Yersinia pestis PY-89]|jgi:hypothetical protein
MVVY